jgi:hypothetical protein
MHQNARQHAQFSIYIKRHISILILTHVKTLFQCRRSNKSTLITGGRRFPSFKAPWQLYHVGFAQDPKA